MTEDRKLLQPFSTVVSVALHVLIAALSVGVLSKLFLGGWGTGDICVADTTASSSTKPTGFAPEQGASVDSVPRYCVENPSSHQRLLDQLDRLPFLLLMIAVLFLLNRLLQGAARDGIYTLQTVSRFRLLGWWVLLGSLAAEVVQANAKAALIASLAESKDFSAASWLGMWTPPYLAVLIALGLLTFARITRAGTAMREDLQGVV
ncbi:hypothetical protein [Streptomyces mutabilis]|uniref:DUF2975 domain-containing protein n=1 Tax=Streptomyces mutabilis TaxID=67332 RepID=A0A086MUS4_9ACTN|nr:hypothetical protein [Streptomyces mutabilis]KFG72642.1 hypothetical protein FM21_17250 [Streptomyces mutabilis]